ncbi:hypothetical protein Tco_0513457 [Tanacetum coccineum]
MDLSDYEVPRVLVTCRITGLRFGVENREEYDTQANLPFRRRVFPSHLDGQHITGMDIANAIVGPTFAELYDDDAVGLRCLGILQLVILGAENIRNVPECRLCDKQGFRVHGILDAFTTAAGGRGFKVTKKATGLFAAVNSSDWKMCLNEYDVTIVLVYISDSLGDSTATVKASLKAMGGRRPQIGDELVTDYLSLTVNCDSLATALGQKKCCCFGLVVNTASITQLNRRGEATVQTRTTSRSPDEAAVT